MHCADVKTGCDVCLWLLVSVGSVYIVH